MKKTITVDELVVLKHGYFAECNWNNSLGGKKRPIDRCKRELRKYGICGSSNEVISNRIDKMIKRIKNG